MLLRRASPFATVLVLLAPATAQASSFSPDPPPGANGLRPDPAVSMRAPLATVPAVVVRRAPVHVVTAPAAPRTPLRTSPRPRRPVAPVRTHTSRLALPRLELPPVVGPALITAPLRQRPQAELAALALALAALTAGSGAGLVRAWSRR